MSPLTTTTTHRSWRGMWLAKRFGVMKAAHTLHNVRPDLQELFQLHFKMRHKKFSLIRRRKMLLIRGNKDGLIMNSYSSAAAAACVPKMLLLIEIILRRVQRGACIIILACYSLSCSAFFFLPQLKVEARDPLVYKYSARYPWDTRCYIPHRLDYFGPFFSQPVSLARASRHERHPHHCHGKFFTPSPFPSCVFCEDLKLWE